MAQPTPKGGARNHHFVPQFYLKGFAALRSKDAKIFAYDLKERRRFQTRPRNIAARRDYNRIEIEGFDPNTVEAQLATVEDEMDRAFGRMINAGSIENVDDFSCVIALLARLFSSNPAIRGTIDKFMTDVATSMMHMMVSTEERWTSVISQARANGVELGDDVPYEQMRDAVVNKDIAVGITRETLIEQEMHLWPSLLPVLEARKWALVVSSAATGEFATCDRPASLRWNDEEMHKGPYGVGLGCTDTTVTFPLSKHLAVMGRFEDGGGVIHASPELVAAFNIRAVASAMRQVYSSTDFPIRDQDGIIKPFSTSTMWERICNRPPDSEYREEEVEADGPRAAP